MELIPIGTVNRTPAENNALKHSDEVAPATAPEKLANQEHLPVTAPQRRFNRRRGERRKSARGACWRGLERRKNRDRRDQERLYEAKGGEKRLTPQGNSRKGCFIDERV